MKPKSKDLKAIAPKINPEAADWYAKMFKSLNAGTTAILDAFPGFYSHALAEMRGVFTINELSMILDITRSWPPGFTSFTGHAIKLSVKSCLELFHGQFKERWNIADPKEFLDRLSGLPLFARVCLDIWAAGFWEQHETVTPEEYCAAMI